jgi:hypothetical protein
MSDLDKVGELAGAGFQIWKKVMLIIFLLCILGCLLFCLVGMLGSSTNGG